MLKIYNRELAKEYALMWATKRNPKFYNFDNLGGDCTNFASQCVYAGCNVMNYSYPLGWYYISLTNRSPSWTSAQFFNDFLTRTLVSIGPIAIETELKNLEIGDIVQIKTNNVFSHSLVITEVVKNSSNPFDYKICAHTNDAYNRRLSTYNLAGAKYLKIIGFYN